MNDVSSTAIAPYSVHPHTSTPANASLRVGAVVSALSQALDLSTGQAVGHSVRTCILGMRLAQEIGMPPEVRQDLFYALLLKDCGCSSNASKMFHMVGSDDLAATRGASMFDWTKTSSETVHYALAHVGKGKSFLERSRLLLQLALKQKRHTHDVMKIQCERGATLVRLMGLSEGTAKAIRSLNEHWDGHGEPDQLWHREIPIHSRVMLLAQTLEVYGAEKGFETALDVVRQRSGTWFEPDLVKAAVSLAVRGKLWSEFENGNPLRDVLKLEPRWNVLGEGGITLDSIALAFAQVVDAKSPFTFNHSNGVANATVAIARRLGLPRERILFLRHAALLHGLGKLGISNAILEKPGKLDETEWEAMRRYPYYTWTILRSIPGFEEMSEVAASHHEKLNGKGYFRGLTAGQMSLDARILVVADIFNALAAKRPYRDALPMDAALSILRKDVPYALDGDCVTALEESGVILDQTAVDLQNLSDRLG
jgi:HD-GYP domain-containing protein (c-di-GMP phosphodiesterase class II)